MLTVPPSSVVIAALETGEVAVHRPAGRRGSRRIERPAFRLGANLQDDRAPAGLGNRAKGDAVEILIGAVGGDAKRLARRPRGLGEAGEADRRPIGQIAAAEAGIRAPAAALRGSDPPGQIAGIGPARGEDAAPSGAVAGLEARAPAVGDHVAGGVAVADLDDVHRFSGAQPAEERPERFGIAERGVAASRLRRLDGERGGDAKEGKHQLCDRARGAAGLAACASACGGAWATELRIRSERPRTA